MFVDGPFMFFVFVLSVGGNKLTWAPGVSRAAADLSEELLNLNMLRGKCQKLTELQTQEVILQPEILWHSDVSLRKQRLTSKLPNSKTLRSFTGSEEYVKDNTLKWSNCIWNTTKKTNSSNKAQRTRRGSVPETAAEWHLLSTFECL